MLKPIQHIIIFAVFAMGCAKSPSSADPSAIRMLVASLPNTLNPRTALDQASQKILAAVYPSVIEPSAPHTVSPDGKRWRFKAGLVAPAENLAECLKEYQTGEPPSAFRDVFKDVAAIEAQGGELAITLKRPNPDFADEATGVRFFRQPGRLACQDPVEGQPITSPGPYRIGDGRYASAIPERRLDLVPNPLTADGLSPLSIYFVKDENTRALRILRGEIDAAWTAISLAKERWIERELTRDFTHQEVHGSSVSYLAFNLNDPILRDVRVRRAIAAAIDKRAIIEQKLYGFCDPASSFLPPDHPDLLKASFPYDPARARAWLDEAGYPARDGKPRFTLKYKTTPVREGIEFSQMVRHYLEKVGIALEIQVLEPAVFLAHTRHGNFQLYSSRWLETRTPAPLLNALRSGDRRNRVGYRNATLDRIIDQTREEPDPKRRGRQLREIQAHLQRDLPYFPLWYWKNSIVLRKDLERSEHFARDFQGRLEEFGKLKRRK